MDPKNTIAVQMRLGKAIAEMYIAAQGVSMEASDAACDAVENAPLWVKFAFNQEMARSPYNVRAE